MLFSFLYNIKYVYERQILLKTSWQNNTKNLVGKLEHASFEHFRVAGEMDKGIHHLPVNCRVHHAGEAVLIARKAEVVVVKQT